MRSFQARITKPVTRIALLAACLLTCLACATRFPIRDLETGMTTETVRERFGAPQSTRIDDEQLESSWTYPHEKTDWSLLLLPHSLLSIPVLAAWPGRSWDEIYVKEAPLVLHFEDGKLIRWEEIETYTESGDYNVTEAMEKHRKQQEHWQRMRDIGHHKKGHTHHHGH